MELEDDTQLFGNHAIGVLAIREPNRHSNQRAKTSRQTFSETDRFYRGKQTVGVLRRSFRAPSVTESNSSLQRLINIKDRRDEAQSREKCAGKRLKNRGRPGFLDDFVNHHNAALP